MKKLKKNRIALFCFVFFSLIIFNNVFSSTGNEELKQAALNYMRSSISHIKEMKVDLSMPKTPLKLPNCKNIFVRFTNPQKIDGRNTLSLSCHNPYWHVYLVAFVRGKRNVLVAKKSIVANSALTTNNLVLQFSDISSLPHGYFSSIKSLQRAKAKVFIPRGKIIEPKMISLEYMVKRNSTVNIYAVNNHVAIKMKGTALQNGMLEDLIKVKNTSSKVVQCRVKGIESCLAG